MIQIKDISQGGNKKKEKLKWWLEFMQHFFVWCGGGPISIIFPLKFILILFKEINCFFSSEN